METTLSNHHLSQQIKPPKYKKEYVLDLLNIPDRSDSVTKLEVIDTGLSDHFVISFLLNVCKNNGTQKKHNTTSRNIKAIDTKAFKNKIQQSLTAPRGHHLDLPDTYITMKH